MTLCKGSAKQSCLETNHRRHRPPDCINALIDWSQISTCSRMTSEDSGPNWRDSGCRNSHVTNTNRPKNESKEHSTPPTSCVDHRVEHLASTKASALGGTTGFQSARRCCMTRCAAASLRGEPVAATRPARPLKATPPGPPDRFIIICLIISCHVTTPSGRHASSAENAAYSCW